MNAAGGAGGTAHCHTLISRQHSRAPGASKQEATTAARAVCQVGQTETARKSRQSERTGNARNEDGIVVGRVVQQHVVLNGTQTKTQQQREAKGPRELKQRLELQRWQAGVREMDARGLHSARMQRAIRTATQDGNPIAAPDPCGEDQITGQKRGIISTWRGSSDVGNGSRILPGKECEAVVPWSQRRRSRNRGSPPSNLQTDSKQRPQSVGSTGLTRREGYNTQQAQDWAHTPWSTQRSICIRITRQGTHRGRSRRRPSGWPL